MLKKLAHSLSNNGVTTAYRSSVCVSPLHQETTQVETSTDPVQHGAVYAGVVGGVPGRLHSHGGLLAVPGGGHPSPLLHPGFVHVDVNGGTAAVPDVGKSAACHRRTLHPESCPDCLGSVGLSVCLSVCRSVCLLGRVASHAITTL